MIPFFYDRFILSLVFVLLVVSACGSDEFSAVKNKGQFSTQDVQRAFNQRCSDFTLVKPKVDFLFVWDNSTGFTGTEGASLEAKKSVNRLITTISGEFDFRILVAPLLGSGNTETYYLANEIVPYGERPRGAVKVNNLYGAADKFQFIPPIPGSLEWGVKRSYDLLSSNRSFFRAKGTMIVVVMSNGDDNYWCRSLNSVACYNPNHTKARAYKREYVSKFKNLGKRFTALRFFALTQGKGRIYREISREVNTGELDSETSYHIGKDGKGVSNAFAGINSAIKKVLIKHKYNFWPVAGPGDGPFDPGTITVARDGEDIPRCAHQITNNCFYYRPEIYRNQNTRYAPTPGDPYTGHLIELRGPKARVRYPECLRVQTTAYRDYYGYVPLGAKPVKGTIELKINGEIVHESASNGWQLITDSQGNPVYRDRQNIKIQVKNGNPVYKNGVKALNTKAPIYKSGYFLELFGHAIYTNGAKVRFRFDPSGI